jgi:glycosyltransferase involved in cell wall biosynthesis
MLGDTVETRDRSATSSASPKTASMKIVQVLPRYAPAWAYGGGVHMFWLLAEELARRGHRIEVITSDSLGKDERAESLEEDLKPNVHVRRFRNRFNAMSASLPAVFYRPRSMRRGLREAMAQADVVHMGESRGIHNLWAAQASAAARVPLVWSAFGGLPTASGVRGVYRRLHDIFLTRHVVPRVDAFVAQSEHEELVYVEHGAPRAKIHRIPLCVDLSLFERLPERGALRSKLGIGLTDHLVVSVARLAPVKGLDLLIDAFGRIPESDRGPHLALVGWDHGSLPALKAQVNTLGLQGRVHFPGALYNEERLIAYRDADVFCLTPTVYEETSLAALEAAASGCPTVLSPQCEIPGLAGAGGGLVVDRRVETVSGAIAQLLADDAHRLGIGEKARAHVTTHFSVSSVGGQYEALFRKLIR